MTVPDPAALYRQEAADLLVQLEETLLNLEADPTDHGLIDQTFRALHTIKGSGAMFGFAAVAAFTHHVETAFDKVRSGLQPVTPDLTSLTLASLDHIRTLIEAPETADEAQGEALLRSLAAIMGEAPAGSGQPAPQPQEAEPAADDQGAPTRWRVRIKLAENVMAYGTNPLLLLDELRSLGPCKVTALTDDIPRLEDMDPAGCYTGWEVELTTTQPRAAIEDVFIFVVDDAVIAIDPLPAEAGQPDEPAAPPPPQIREESPAAAQPCAPASPPPTQAPQKTSAADQHAASIRVQADRLDSLVDQVGELVIAQARLRQLVAASDDINLRSVAEEIERLASDLRDTTMSIRMLPIGTLFGRFRRVVRDLSQSLGKDIILTTAGEETELDKTVIESLNDPLVHLIRNSADHGIESAEEREQAGKPRAGQVHLSAVHSGAQVLITITDDGRGMNRDAIRAKAVERGLIGENQEISDSELYAFIFHPGFSTAKQVSSVSGRGVGMDVVKQTIDGLRGTIEVASTPGQGSRITLKLPLTLAIIEGLLVRVGTGRYVIPLAAVEECVELTTQQDNRSSGCNFLNIRNEIVPFVRLREIFGVEDGPSDYQKVAIISSGGTKVGLVVDQVIGQYQTVIKSLSKLLDDVEGFSGATILGNGSVALILDVPHLIHYAQTREMVLKAS